MNTNHDTPILGALTRRRSLAFLTVVALFGALGLVVLPASWDATKYTRNLATGSASAESSNGKETAAAVVEISKKIAVIHLGKCHGIGMQHSLRKHKESAIVKQGYDWYHMEHVPVEKHTDFIAIIRNPIDRVISTFLFEHPKNLPYRKNPMHVTMPYVDKLKLYDCYDTMDDLATNGMALLPPGQKETECSTLAKKLLADYMSFPGMTHFVFNYQSYYDELLKQSKGKTIYAVRAEHMLDDMNVIERLISGDPNRTEFPALSTFSHYKPGHTSKSLPVTDKTVSEAGMRNLCEMLCQELLRYKQLVNEAKNLNDADQAEMHAKVKAQCPSVADLEKCPNKRAEFPR